MTAQEKALHIDIPVKLTEVKVVFSIASLSFEGVKAHRGQVMQKMNANSLPDLVKMAARLKVAA